MKLKLNNAKWKFSIHANPDKGPNRITFDPSEAERFFKKLLKRSKMDEEPMVRVIHLPTNMLWETDDPGELNHFIFQLVNRVGTIRYD